ncbi:hypothetical protein [Mucilaginibacter sp.]|uniref:hypothetical protein n=1 Tax=Mucilaginibacter sp. TaxID=1882438 RepID=UPI00260DF46D|nr:hypothetical protein [Mucilaginibacter sp.]MDB4924367.1 hypothetical protein [Mucilaginibacter sp.]
MKNALALLPLAIILMASCHKDIKIPNAQPSKSIDASPSISNSALENWFVKNPMGKYLSVDWKKAKQITIGNVAVVTVPVTHISLPSLLAALSSSDKKVNDVGSSGNAVLTTFDPYHPPSLYFFQDKTRANPDSVKALLMNFSPDDPKKENGAKKIWTGTLSEWDMQGR